MIRCNNCDSILDDDGNEISEDTIIGCKFNGSFIPCEDCSGKEYDSKECKKIRKNLKVILLKVKDLI